MVKEEAADAYAGYPEVTKEIGDFRPEPGYGEGEYQPGNDPNGYENGAEEREFKQEPGLEDEEEGAGNAYGGEEAAYGNDNGGSGGSGAEDEQ